MTDEIKVQPQEKVDEKKVVNSVNVGNVPNSADVQTVRPTFLSVLCILTFIGSGLSVLGYLLTAVFSGILSSLGGEIPAPFNMLVPDVGVVSGIISLLAAVASFVGAIKMWKLQKLGFYLYAAGQVVMLVLGFGVMSLIFTALFIVLYGINLKHLK